MLGKKLVLAKYEPEEGRTSAKSKDGGKGKSGVAAVVKPRLEIELLTPDGEISKFKAGEELIVMARVSDSAYVYCYYQDSDNNVARIFPNRFSANSYVAANKWLRIPEQGALFKIIFERAGATERIHCMASRREVGMVLSPAFMVGDLEPIPGKSMNDVIAEFEKIDRTGLEHQGYVIEVAQ